MGRWRCESRSRTPPPALNGRRYEPSEASSEADRCTSESDAESGEACKPLDRSGNFEPTPRPTEVSLTFANLAALRASAPEDKDNVGAFSKNGMSRKRIKNVLSNKKASGCICSSQSCPQPARCVVCQLFPNSA